MPLLKSNKELYKAFNRFYLDSIRQETKDEWGGPYYQKIDQINGVNYFDYSSDGLQDALVEFSAAASDGGTAYYLTAVLFEKKNELYNYVTHINPYYTTFEKFENSIFYFKGTWYKALLDENRFYQFKLINNKFEIIDSK